MFLRFPPPCESKQMLIWVHFPSACFLKFYWRSFRSASGHHHTYRIRFFWPARPSWLSWLSLVDPNKFWPGFTFPQPGFSNFIGVRFAQPLNTNIHICRIRFPWPARPNWLVTQPSGPKQIFTCVRIHFPSAWFLKFYWGSFSSASGH